MYNNVFYSAAYVTTGTTVDAQVTVSWDTQFRDADYIGRPFVLIQPLGGRDPGLYVFNGSQYVFSIGYEDFGKLVSGDAKITVVYMANSDVTVTSNQTVWTGGLTMSGVTTIPANTNAVYVLTESATADAVAGEVKTVNSKTPDANGNVQLAASDVGAATAAQGAKADTALQSVPVATASAVGGVKVAEVATSNMTLAADGTLSVATATNATKGVASFGSGLAVNNGVVTVAAVAATAGSIGGVTRQPAMADIAADPVQKDFNDLLAALRLAGILA